MPIYARTRFAGQREAIRAQVFAGLRLALMLLCIGSPAHSGVAVAPRALVLASRFSVREDSVDQASCMTMLRVCGLSPVLVGDVDEMLRHDPRGLLMVIPAAAARTLPLATAGRVLAQVRAGARLFTDAPGALFEAAGIRLLDAVPVRTVRDSTRPGTRLIWEASVPVAPIATSTSEGERIVYRDAASGRAVGVLRSFGKGQALFLATLFDPVTREGYGRFPSLPSVLLREMGLAPVFRGAGAHAYFDPGYINNARDERRIRMWRDAGITAVHVGMWQRYADDAFDYRRFVETAHRYGIRAYLWLMWPYVGDRFWNAHPEWRQKNGALGDAKLDFLLLMDFQIPACFNAAMQDLASMLSLDWDGVDIAEFSVTGGVADALDGASKPENLVGFGSRARAEFQTLHGFDPVALLDRTSPRYWERDSAAMNAFYEYRAGVSVTLLSRVVAAIDSLNRLRAFPLELVLTVLDDSQHPEFRRFLAYDGTLARTLTERYGMTLQVEDPMSEWVRPPSRYTEMAATYRDLLLRRPFSIDINVVPVHWAGQPGFPTEQPTGTEFLLQWRAAAARTEYVTFYSEYSVHPEDWALLPFAMAADAAIARGPDADTLRLPHAAIFQNFASGFLISVETGDSMVLPAGPVLLPPGVHLLLPAKQGPALSGGIRRPRLYPVCGTREVQRITYSRDAVRIAYDSRSRMPLTCNRRPARVTIDGKRARPPLFRNRDGVVVFLPPGHHTAECWPSRHGT